MLPFPIPPLDHSRCLFVDPCSFYRIGTDPILLGEGMFRLLQFLVCRVIRLLQSFDDLAVICYFSFQRCVLRQESFQSLVMPLHCIGKSSGACIQELLHVTTRFDRAKVLLDRHSCIVHLELTRNMLPQLAQGATLLRRPATPLNLHGCKLP